MGHGQIQCPQPGQHIEFRNRSGACESCEKIVLPADPGGPAAPQALTQNSRTKISVQQQGAAPAFGHTRYGAFALPGVGVKQLRTRLLYAVGIIYNDPGVLFVGARLHWPVLCFCLLPASIRRSVPPPDQQPRKICILRLSALGDATHVVPVVRSIQDNWPGAQISWIIGKLEHRLLSGLKNIEFIEFDKRGGWSAVRQLRNQLKDRRFDVLLHMQVAARSNLLSKLVRAPVRLGWDRTRSRDLHHHFVRQQVSPVPFQHQVQGFLEFPRAMGIEVTEPRWDIPIGAEAMRWADTQLGPGSRTLIISPCSSHPLRNWSTENYAQVADFAHKDLGLQVVLSGGPGKLEQETGAAIEAKMQGGCLNLVGKDTLEQSKALLRKADLVISPDSGPAHIASALGTPVIGLYAATWSRRSGPYNSLDLCVDRFEQAALRFRNKSPEDLRWGTRIEEPGVMDLVTTTDVINKLESWYAENRTF